MDEHIPVSLGRIREIIAGLPDLFTTIDVIEKYSGGFYSNTGTPAYYSFNAQFGKLLKRNEPGLGIEQINESATARDALGHPTSTSEWRKVASASASSAPAA